MRTDNPTGPAADGKACCPAMGFSVSRAFIRLLEREGGRFHPVIMDREEEDHPIMSWIGYCPYCGKRMSQGDSAT